MQVEHRVSQEDKQDVVGAYRVHCVVSGVGGRSAAPDGGAGREWTGMHRASGVSGRVVNSGLRSSCPDPVFPEEAQSLAGSHSWWGDGMGRGAGVRHT